MAKTWFITGTSSGFGKDLAIRLAKQSDVNVVATARHTEALDYLDEFDKGQILKAQLDVTKPEEIKAAVQAAVDKFGTIDVLDNNAGLGYFSTFEEGTDADIKKMFDVNVFGLINVTKEVLPIMRKQNSGIIMGLSSVLGQVGLPSLSYYAGTKFAVEGMYEALKQELSKTNIKVMLIEPSGFRTDWAGRSSNKTDTKFPDVYGDVQAGIDSVGKGDEPGDPKKAAEIIVKTVEKDEELPFRLPLGQASVEGTEAKLKADLAEIEKMHDQAVSADFS
ncbi:SDR family NAD(P)-dependent oxidoreductase [Fructobacillus sp. W13]|uniref:SDR family NAD(P)-dependent oxidoreductase n=1 Tax=Fructobacillus apis TaxID=2935017 RepID=A0ABT0ZPU7_9LACO|nr:SDR family NAD(P)-dependent oxidoreductase [Fructobacillus apis]MCO0832006.1 SDR family NAD(P)-dependent oxidoreductase [Fructobacillus apis]